MFESLNVPTRITRVFHKDAYSEFGLQDAVGKKSVELMFSFPALKI